MSSHSENTGPYITIAAICEKVIEDKNGVLSLISVIDRVNHSYQRKPGQTAHPVVQYPFVIVISLKSGSARGSHTITIRPELPNGLRKEEIHVPVLLEGEDRGMNIVMQMQFPMDMEGLYWFDVLLERQLITRMSLRLVYQPYQVGSGDESR